MDQLNGSPLPVQTSCSGGTAWHKTWQTDSDSALRQTVAANILQDIFRELQGPLSPELQQVLCDLVMQLEEELYRSAGTKEEYADQHTVESRLQAVAKRVTTGKQSAPQHGSQTMSSSPGSAYTIVPTGRPVGNVNSTSVLFADVSI